MNELISDVSSICQKYLCCLKNIECKLSTHSLKIDDEDLNFACNVILAFQYMSYEGKEYINNEYFIEKYHWWWKNIYSASTFYRRKKTYSKQFLNMVRYYEAIC